MFLSNTDLQLRICSSIQEEIEVPHEKKYFRLSHRRSTVFCVQFCSGDGGLI